MKSQRSCNLRAQWGLRDNTIKSCEINNQGWALFNLPERFFFVPAEFVAWITFTWGINTSQGPEDDPPTYCTDSRRVNQSSGQGKGHSREQSHLPRTSRGWYPLWPVHFCSPSGRQWHYGQKSDAMLTLDTSRSPRIGLLISSSHPLPGNFLGCVKQTKPDQPRTY